MQYTDYEFNMYIFMTHTVGLIFFSSENQEYLMSPRFSFNYFLTAEYYLIRYLYSYNMNYNSLNESVEKIHCMIVYSIVLQVHLLVLESNYDGELLSYDLDSRQ